MMKRALLGVVAAVAALSIGGASAFAAGFGAGWNYTDADGDGVCDYAGSDCVYADANGDGLCDGCGVYHGSCLTGDGKYFVDADGDGICDHCGIYHWRGVNYTDADGDGVCDNYAAGWGMVN